MTHTASACVPGCTPERQPTHGGGRDGAGTLSPAEVDVGLYYVRQRADPQYTAHRPFDEDVLTVC